MNAEKNREKRLRWRLDNISVELHKNPSRDKQAWNYGLYSFTPLTEEPQDKFKFTLTQLELLAEHLIRYRQKCDEKGGRRILKYLRQELKSWLNECDERNNKAA